MAISDERCDVFAIEHRRTERPITLCDSGWLFDNRTSRMVGAIMLVAAIQIVFSIAKWIA